MEPPCETGREGEAGGRSRENPSMAVTHAAISVCHSTHTHRCASRCPNYLLSSGLKTSSTPPPPHPYTPLSLSLSLCQSRQLPPRSASAGTQVRLWCRNCFCLECQTPPPLLLPLPHPSLLHPHTTRQCPQLQASGFAFLTRTSRRRLALQTKGSNCCRPDFISVGQECLHAS